MIAWVDKFKRIILLSFLFISFVLLFGCIKTPEDKVYFNELKLVSDSLTNEKIEIDLIETELFLELDLNYYSYQKFKVEGTFYSPEGTARKISAFWFQDYELVLDETWTTSPSGISGKASTNPDEPQGLERATKKGDPHYRFRYLTAEVGTHNLNVKIYMDNKEVQQLNFQFNVKEGLRESKGVIKIEENSKRHFVFENGETFMPIGENTGWYTSSTRKTEDYGVWFSKLAENSANFARVWLSPTSFSLHDSQYNDFTSAQPKLIRLDKVFDLADEYEIYFMLTLINHGQFSTTTNPSWGNNPWNVTKGGILNKAYEFFISKDAKKIYKDQLTYIISRWGYSDKVIWELFNEVDWTDGYSIDIKSWHKEMATHIKNTDAYQHLVTTSYKGEEGSAYDLTEIDFINPHSYSYSNVNVMEKLTPIIKRLFDKYKKPVLHSEIGISHLNGISNFEADPTGISIKQNQWAGMMSGSAGGAMNWWWDSYIHPNDLYYRFKGAGEYAKKLNLSGSSYQLLNDITVNNSSTKLLGYKVDNNIYGYLYDKNWKYNNPVTLAKTVTVNIPLENGSYLLEKYDTDSGELLFKTSFEIDNNIFSYDFTYLEDSAFIVKPIELEEGLFSDLNLLGEAKVNEKIEFELIETTEYLKLALNPYSYDEFKVIGTFKSPSGEERVVNAFWFLDYDLYLDSTINKTPTGISGMASTNPNELQGEERVIVKGNPHYRLRYSTNEEGLHNLTIKVYLENNEMEIITKSFNVEAGVKTSKGVIKIEETHKRNFIFENGETFIPIGENTSWYTSSTRKTEDYRIWFSKLAENSANFARVWMATWGFALHTNSYQEFDLENAIRLDKVFDLADQYEIYFMLAFLNHGQFSETVNAEWGNNPWNQVNGGILNKPKDFFTNSEAKAAYKNQLSYIIARWGYSDKVIWELWNEVDWVNASANDINNWHQEMSTFVKEKDGYRHLVTTSYKGKTGSSYNLENIDFVNPHDYGYRDLNVMEKLVPDIKRIYDLYQKPVLQSEIGIDYQNGQNNRNLDPTGISIKQSQWAGMMGGGAGGAMNWWWDSYVHPNDLYYRFKGAGEFSKKMDMVGISYNLLQSLNGVNVNNNNTKLIGYKIDERVYGYLYDKSWKYNNTNINDKNVKVEIPLSNGSYLLEIYDTDSGELIESINKEIINGKFSHTFTVREDKAFIIKEK